jgi:type I restriction enzyme S subunit
MNGVIARAIAKISVIDSNIISEGFVKHWLLINEKYFIENAKGAAIKKFALGRLNEFKIPIPPIEIQNKIVDILDNFQELTSELISELTKELLSRKEQYHYYRSMRYFRKFNYFNKFQNKDW